VNLAESPGDSEAIRGGVGTELGGRGVRKGSKKRPLSGGWKAKGVCNHNVVIEKKNPQWKKKRVGKKGEGSDHSLFREARAEVHQVSWEKSSLLNFRNAGGVQPRKVNGLKNTTEPGETRPTPSVISIGGRKIGEKGEN